MHHLSPVDEQKHPHHNHESPRWSGWHVCSLFWVHSTCTILQLWIHTGPPPPQLKIVPHKCTIYHCWVKFTADALSDTCQYLMYYVFYFESAKQKEEKEKESKWPSALGMTGDPVVLYPRALVFFDPVLGSMYDPNWVKIHPVLGNSMENSCVSIGKHDA